jgi:threonine dehydrogenase-like Zn-dependent dehydrogenase
VAIDLSKPDLTVAVFGAGTMGRGIAQMCAQAGVTTLLFDSRDDAVKEAIAAVDKGLEGLVAKQRMTPAEKKDVLDHLKPINRSTTRRGRHCYRSDRRRPCRQTRAVARAGKARVARLCARHQHIRRR